MGSVSQAASLARSLPVSKLSSVTKLNDMVSDDIRVGDLHMNGFITEAEAVNAISDPTGSYSMSIIKKFEDRNPGVASKRRVVTSTVPSGTKNQTPSRTIEAFQLYSSQDRLDEQNSKGYKLVPEPLVYMWKSPKGNSIEIDDTGYSNTGKADGNLSKKDQSTQQIPDNRGIRLTTTYGQLLHLTDEAGYENILLRDSKNNYLQFDTVANNCNLMVNNDMSETISGNVTTKIGKNDSISIGKILSIDVGDKLIITTAKESSLKSESLMIETKKDVAIKSGTTAHLFGKEQVSVTTDKLTAGGSSMTNLGLGSAINTLGSSDSSATGVAGSKVGLEMKGATVPTVPDHYYDRPVYGEEFLKIYKATVTDGVMTLKAYAFRAVPLPEGEITIPLT